MSNQRVVVGAVLLAVLAAAAMASVYTSDAPTVIIVLVTSFGVATLVAVGVWAADRSRHVAMRLAAGFTVVLAILAIPPLVAPDPGGPSRVFLVVYIVATAAAVVLVRPELARRTRTSTGARAA